MASISRQLGGRRTIQFLDGKKRRSIRLGRCSERDAETIRLKVEHLIFAKNSGFAPNDEIARWLADLDDTLRDKLVRVGLVPKRESATLGLFADAYIASRADLRPISRVTYRLTRANLVDHFGAGKLLREITPGDADGWRLSLIGQGLKENTVRLRTTIAKVLFKAALRAGLVTANPFLDLPSIIRGDKAKFRFVTRDEIFRVLESCPSAEWRGLVVLSRFGGLRVPSEALKLRWADVDWHNGRMTVHSTKTGNTRTLPLFPELVEPLRELFEAAEPGTRAAEFVIPMETVRKTRGMEDLRDAST